MRGHSWNFLYINYFDPKSLTSMTLYGHYRDPSPWWHVARFDVWSNSIRTLKEGHVTHIAIQIKLHPDSSRGHVGRSPIRTPSGKSTRHSRMSRPDNNISYPDHWLKWASLATLFRQPTTAHDPPPAERKDRVGGRSPPTIHRLQSERTRMMASHLPRSLTAAKGWWWPCHHLGVIMTSQKVLPSLKREDELLTLYKGTFTQGRR